MIPQKSVLTFSDTKISALLNDNIIPVEFSHLIPLRDSGEPQAFELLSELLPPSLIDTNAPRGIKTSFVSYVSHYLVTFPGALGITELPSGQSLNQRAQKRFPVLIDALHSVLSNAQEPIEQIVGAPNIKVSENNDDDIDIVISGLKVVDANELSWKHILEFREDKQSKRKLRNLQLFLYDNYQGKSEQYIVDSVHKKIDEYEEICKKWRLDTVEASLDVVFSSKAVIALTTAGLVSAFGVIPAIPAGGAAAFSLASAIGSVFTIGKLSIGIQQKRRELRDFRNNDPVSFLIDVKERQKS